MRSAVKKFGNSAGVVIPKPILLEFGAETGDSVEMTVEGGRLVVERVVKKTREGWAEAAEELAATGDDALVWPEFPHDEDEKLTW